LQEVVSQVGQLSEEFTALETWLTSGFIPKGLATPIDADSEYDCAPLAPQRAIPRWGEQNSQSPPSEQSLARGDLGGFSQTRPSPIHTSIQQHPTPNPTMEDSWSTPVGGDQVSQGNNSDVFVNSGDVQFSRVESGATRRQKLEGRGQKVPTTTPAQELTLDQELFPSSSVAPSTQSRSKQPTLDRNEALLPKHSNNVQGLKELAELLPSQEQLDLPNPNLVSASDPMLYSNLVDREHKQDKGDQVLFTNATPDQLIDDYGSGDEISDPSPETLQRFPLGADTDIASPPGSFAPSTQPLSKKPTLGRNEVVLPKHSSNVQGLKELAELLPSQEQLNLANPNLVSESDPTLHSNLVDREHKQDKGDQVLFTNATPDQLIDSYRSGEEIGIAESSDEYEWGGNPGWPRKETGKMPIPQGKMPIPQNSSNHSMIKQPQEISGGSPESLQRFPLAADIDITPPQALQTSSDPSAISPQRSALSDQPSAISPQPSAISPQRSAISHYPLPITHYPLPITHHPLPITHYPSPITHYPSPILPIPAS
ncbi:MAG: hypothetical protein F6K20_21765, partial [Moorea sp. SIO2C4]|nr:hypothetical protein [Moorena sp. SIO2C4]